MKMPEKRSLLSRHSRGKGTKASGQSLRLQWRTFAADNGGAFTKTVIDATMCAIIA